MKPEDRIGRVLAERYRLESILGKGGMGAVYAGTHTWMDRPVAIKVLAPDYADSGDVVRRFFQEARVAANLRHPNVVDVLDMGEDDDGVPFLVMERLEGETLAARLRRESKLAVDEALRALVPVLDALAFVHAHGILHRDLKPENVFLAKDFRGRPLTKLLDFGVAKLLENAGQSTRTGSVLGTPAYMAPEQLRGAKDIASPADVWAMGMILYRTLAGRLPVELGPTPMEALLKIATADMPSLRVHAPDVPPVIAGAVDAALRRDPALRTGSVTELLDALLEGARASGLRVRDPREEG